MQLYPPSLLRKTGFETIRNRLIANSESEMAREQLLNLNIYKQQEPILKHLEQSKQMLGILKAGAHFPLNSLPDIRPWLEKCSAEGAILPGQGILEIREMAGVSRVVKHFVRNHQSDLELNMLEEITGKITSLKSLEDEISSYVDENGEVKDNATAELRSIRQSLNLKRSNIRKTVQRVMQSIQSKGMASDEGITIRSGRMVIPVQAEFKRKVKGFIHDVSSSGQTVFLEPVEALTLNNEIRQLEIEERKEIERILQQLTSEIRKHQRVLRLNIRLLAELDVIQAKARLANNLEGQFPKVTTDGPFILRFAKNPVLQIKELSGAEGPVVPLNLEMEADERCLVITGPNAGGKSVAMKTVALCCLMTQAGIPVPADPMSRLPVYKQLFLDIGDDQSIENDLSTFSSRLDWMKITLEQAGKESLVLIDEAASGTDPEEGGALYQAFLEQLIDKGCRIIVTTHHGSLKIFADNHPGAVNGSMEFDMEHLSPTYRFKKGLPGSSYAFEIAARMNLKHKLIERAKTLLGEPKRNLEHLINELEAETQQARSSRSEYEALKKEIEALKESYNKKLKSVQEKREELRREALREAEKIVEEANSRVERVIQEISERGRALEKEDIKNARRTIADKKREVKEKIQKEEAKEAARSRPSGEKPYVGDVVRLQETQTSGELVEVEGNDAVLLVNGLRIKTDYRKLLKIRDGKSQKATKRSSRHYTSDYNPRGRIPPSLMIRGMRAKEAMQKVERYIDDAVAAGMHQVQVIHGKGEGILKEQVHSYLKRRKEVKNFQIAPVHLGGAGCTIIKFE